MARRMTFMKIADSRILGDQLSDAELLVHMDRQISDLRSELELSQCCTITVSTPQYANFDEIKSRQWRATVEITKSSRKLSWDDVIAAVDKFVTKRSKLVYA